MCAYGFVLPFTNNIMVWFLSYIEQRGSSEEWKNAFRWLSSTSGITATSPTGEIIAGVSLEDCDYRITHPQIGDEVSRLLSRICM